MVQSAALEGLCNDLSAAVQSLANLHHPYGSARSDEVQANNSDAIKEVQKAKDTILGQINCIKRLVAGPAYFLQELACHVEMVACLQWLAEFQILTCIPPDLRIHVPIKDLADLAGVPENHLRRVIRLTATGGFLEERPPSSVAHTPLSAQFITNQALLDAAVFLAEWAVPAALQMPSATQQFGASTSGTECAYNLALSTDRPFQSALEERPKLQRQWSAYLALAAGLHQEREVIVDVLSELNWVRIGTACVVEVGAQSTSMAQALTERFPLVRMVVQIDSTHHSSLLDPDHNKSHQRHRNEVQSSHINTTTPTPNSISSSGVSSITVAYRAVGMAQTITDAAVYILHLPPCSTRTNREDTIKRELQDYLEILRVSGAVMLVLTTRLLPEPGVTSESNVEVVARVRDLFMHHLANGDEMELSELLSMIEMVEDGVGKLSVTKQLRAHNHLTTALVVKYQAC